MAACHRNSLPAAFHHATGPYSVLISKGVRIATRSPEMTNGMMADFDIGQPPQGLLVFQMTGIRWTPPVVSIFRPGVSSKKTSLAAPSTTISPLPTS